MGVAKVAIVGRPNVGKSSIFNWLIGERVSIVDSVAGVTRDRVSFLLDIGLDGVPEEYLPQEIDSNWKIKDQMRRLKPLSQESLDQGEDELEEEAYEEDELAKDDDSASLLPADGSVYQNEEEEDPDDQTPAPFLVDAMEQSQDVDDQAESVNPEEDLLFDSTLDDLAEQQDDDQEEPQRPQISTRYIELIDSGGIGVVDKDDLSEDVELQIQAAINSADLILFVVDARDGIAPLDEHVAERLRKLRIPVLLVANKCDGTTQEDDAKEFYKFGWDVVFVSAKQKRGRVALMDQIEKALPLSAFFDNAGENYKEPEMKIAIVGRRNVGKSTFINALVKEERVIASPVPGTTRDCIDVRFELDGKSFIAIDTPGFMRKKSLSSDLDFYALTRAERSIRMADVVLMFFDCSLQIAKMDKQLASLIESYNKPCIFVVNKWDKMARYKMPTSRWADYLRETFATMWHVPIAFVTGMTGKNVPKLLQHARLLYRQSQMRVPTNRLNKLVAAALNHTPPPLFHYRKPKIYYAAQVAVAPPTIVMFCNMPDAFSPSYRRFLLNVIRDELPIGEVPIRLWFRKREADDDKDDIDRRRIT
ncbi:MAG: ribosome biogenesis GTPase Der [Planctomycetia bacterium]|nr:ribosome biogenesis GTPase Der [Planctomycetia bacterium]